MVNPQFFVENGCTNYEAQFIKAPIGKGHKIPADLVRSSGLFDAFLRYKSRKRVTKVRELCAEGMSIGDAAAQAGFNDYSSFYRAYQKEYGTSPREDL